MQRASELIPIINPTIKRGEQRKLLSAAQMQLLRQIDGSSSLGSLCAILGRPLLPMLKHIETMTELEVIYLTKDETKEPLATHQWKAILAPQSHKPTESVESTEHESHSPSPHTTDEYKTNPPATYAAKQQKTNPSYQRPTSHPLEDEPTSEGYPLPSKTNRHAVPVLPLEEFIPKETLSQQNLEPVPKEDSETNAQHSQEEIQLPYHLPQETNPLEKQKEKRSGFTVEITRDIPEKQRRNHTSSSKECTPPYSFAGLPATTQQSRHQNAALTSPVEVLYKKEPSKETVETLTKELNRWTIGKKNES